MYNHRVKKVYGVSKMDIGDKVLISDFAFCYDCEGEIIGETKTLWKVKTYNHKTMNELWKNQKEKIVSYYKIGLHNKGWSKEINTGCFTKILGVLK